MTRAAQIIIISIYGHSTNIRPPLLLLETPALSPNVRPPLSPPFKNDFKINFTQNREIPLLPPSFPKIFLYGIYHLVEGPTHAFSQLLILKEID